MGDFKLDQQSFFKRLNSIYSAWQDPKSKGLWGDSDAFYIAAGKKNEDESVYRKSLITHHYLLAGLEFPNTIMLMTKGKFYILAGSKQFSLLEEILPGNDASEVKLHLLKRSKADSDAENIQKLIGAISGKKLGSLEKEKPEGDLIQAWNEAVKKAELQLVDIAAGLASIFAIKDDGEVDLVRKAGALSSKVMKSKLIPDMEVVIDEKKQVSHEKLSEDVEGIFENISKINPKLNQDYVESCYVPIIQSGGEYDLKPSAQSTNKSLKYDVIVASLGARYRNYCSNVGRTFFVDPVPSMEKNYDVLLRAQERLINELKPGREIRQAVESCKDLIKRDNPKLLPYLTKTLGFGIGMEFRESSLMLSHKNHTVIREGMCFNVAVGLQDIPIDASEKEKALKKSKNPSERSIPDKYSILLIDTVVVSSAGPQPVTKVSKQWSHVSYVTEGSDDEGEDDDGEEDKKKKEKKGKENGSSSIHGPIDTGLARTRGAMIGARLRDQQRQLEGKETAEAKRERHQQELMKRKKEEAERRLQREAGGPSETEKKVDVKTITAYNNVEDYPRDVSKTQISVDFEREAVLLPINGLLVPFHIKTIKNVSKNDEEKATYLRINFYTPAQTLGKDVAPVMAAMVGKNETKMFIKELNFRSVQARNLNNQFRLIKELQKRVRQKEAERQEQADLVIQEELILTRDRRVPRLSDLNMRPHISGRKTQGALEAHANGLRFTSIKGETLDILYSNIKHAIFQPCESELVVLLHFHLKNHIMIGKKKQKDVQFYTEVMEASQALDNRRRSTYDPDELDEEQRERQLRSRLNQTFKEFAKKVEATAERADRPVQFDIPYRELAFSGTPFKEMVLLQPSVNCLVNLTEMPFFIISLEDIEHVHFERVSFGSKNFDMAIILKDFNIVPPRISAISMKDLDSIKEWLDDIDITFTEGPATLNWKNLMEKVKEEMEEGVFYLDQDTDGVPKPAGWNFLRVDGSDDESEDEEDEDSNFSDELEEDEEEDESSEDEDEDGSDWDSIVSEEDESEVEEEDDAPTWEELEREAIAADRRSKREAEQSDSEEDRKKKKRRKR